jgi:FKBP-type peptidyl-prolyl cis-trans isomerase SlyD
VEVFPEKRVGLRVKMTTRYPDGATKEREEEMTFVYGVEPQVPTLDRALQGRKSGETFHVAIPSSELYGEHDPGLVLEVPRKGLISQRLQ